MIDLNKWVAVAAVVFPAAAFAGEGEANLVLFFGRFHPLVLHLPIGILTAATLFEVYNVWKPGKVAPEVTTALIGLGAATAVVAVAAGLMLEQGGGYDPDTLDRHKWITIAMTVLAIVAFFLKRKADAAGSSLTGYRVCLVLTMLLMGPGGHEGANMTHGKTYLSEKAPEPVKSIIEVLSGIKKGEEVTVPDGYYANEIYQEYSFLGRETYIVKRKEVLEHFLDGGRTIDKAMN